MRKLLLLASIALVGCVEENTTPTPPLTFEVKCPLNTIEIAVDTVEAHRYFYSNRRLAFYSGQNWAELTRQFPNTCVVKEIQ